MPATVLARLPAAFIGLSAGLILASSSAFAVDGRTAVGMCIDSTASGARCGWSVNDKGEIDICNKNGCVYCASATSQCVAAAKTRPKPKTWLPTGTEVVTPLGSFKVAPRPISGSILKAEPKAAIQ